MQRHLILYNSTIQEQSKQNFEVIGSSPVFTSLSAQIHAKRMHDIPWFHVLVYSNERKKDGEIDYNLKMDH